MLDKVPYPSLTVGCLSLYKQKRFGFHIQHKIEKQRHCKPVSNLLVKESFVRKVFFYEIAEVLPLRISLASSDNLSDTGFS